MQKAEYCIRDGISDFYEHIRRVNDVRDAALETAIRNFRECGVSLDRMYLIGPSDGSATTLYVDDIARFEWRLIK